MPRKHALGETDNDRIFIGEDVTIRCQLVTRNPTTGADAVEGDISSNAYRFEVKAHAGDTTALIDLATGGDGITFANGDTTKGELTGSNTVMVIAMSDTETELIPAAGVYYFDIWRTDAGFEAVVAYGKITFSDSVRL